MPKAERTERLPFPNAELLILRHHHQIPILAVRILRNIEGISRLDDFGIHVPVILEHRAGHAIEAFAIAEQFHLFAFDQTFRKIPGLLAVSLHEFRRIDSRKANADLIRVRKHRAGVPVMTVLDNTVNRLRGRHLLFGEARCRKEGHR